MTIRVTYLAQLRRLMRSTSDDVELSEGSTLSDLLHHLASMHREAEAILLDREGNPHGSLLMFREEEQVDGKSVLTNGDRVTLLTPMAGG